MADSSNIMVEKMLIITRRRVVALKVLKVLEACFSSYVRAACADKIAISGKLRNPIMKPNRKDKLLIIIFPIEIYDLA